MIVNIYTNQVSFFNDLPMTHLTICEEAECGEKICCFECEHRKCKWRCDDDNCRRTKVKERIYGKENV